MRSQIERLVLEGSHRQRSFNRRGIYLVGKPGCGKSYYANMFNVESSYNKGPNRWFCGYTNEEVLIIDDLDHSNATVLSYLLKIWADRYSILSEVKGGSVYLQHSTVIVTSNYRIDTLYQDDDLRLALHRRFKEIVVLDWRETPLGNIEIKTLGPNMNFIWLNNVNIFDLC